MQYHFPGETITMSGEHDEKKGVVLWNANPPNKFTTDGSS